MSSKNQLKDVDSVRQAILLNNFMRTVPFLGVLGLMMGGLPGLLIAAVASAIVSVCTEMFSGMVGSGALNTLYGIGRRTSTLRERLAGDMSRVRFDKMKQDHDSALVKLEEILAYDPDFPEALFLKAQILWEGCQDRAAAKACLMRVIKAEPDKNAVFHRWALNLYREINKQRVKLDHGQLFRLPGHF
jgi:tetratricopeptide (TPR) repeat protein